MANHAQRRLREKNELRLKILDAARELFGTEGEDAVTLRAVAERIEYSATTIYLHFADKDALLRELCATDFLLHSRAFKQAERVGDPVERLRRMAAAYIDFGLQYPGHYRLMFLPSSGGAPAKTASKAPVTSVAEPAGPPEAEPEESPYSFLHAAVFKAMAAGCFRPEYRDVAAIAQLLWSGLHGVTALRLVRAKHPHVPWKAVDASAQMMIDCLLTGLLSARHAAALAHL